MGNFNNINPGSISISDFNYPLPDEKIAKYPLPQRDQSKLLVWKDHSIEDCIFSELPDLLPANSLLIFNNTKVIRARLLFEKKPAPASKYFVSTRTNPPITRSLFSKPKHVPGNA